MLENYRTITKEEEHNYQYCNRSRAAAEVKKRNKSNDKIQHMAVKCFTWRYNRQKDNYEQLYCYNVVLK